MAGPASNALRCAFLGVAREVAGCMCLPESGGKRMLLECGLARRGRKHELKNRGYANSVNRPPVYPVHGEQDTQTALTGVLRQRLTPPVEIAAPGQSVNV